MRQFLSYVIRVAGVAALVCVAAQGAAHAQCADYNDDGSVTAVDALGVLRVATGSADCDVYRCDVDGSGAVSAADALRTLKLALGQPIVSDCPEDPDQCLNDTEFFFQRIWTPIQTDCVTCHNPGGIANYTRHILLPSSEMGYVAYNFNAWKAFADLPGGRELLLTKPLGIDHAGGQRLGMTPDSVHYANILELFDRFDEPIENCASSADFRANLTYHFEVDMLHKAAILFAARHPTESEMAAVLTAGDAELRRLVRRLMSVEPFDGWVMEAAHDHLLTDKQAIDQSNAFSGLKGEYEYPPPYECIHLVRDVF